MTYRGSTMAIEPEFEAELIGGNKKTPPPEPDLSGNLVKLAGTAMRVRIHGRVQGVFFRVWATDTARAIGVAGWVRNRHDGFVEAHFEGSPDAVESVISRCREGSLMAIVDGVETTSVELEGCTGFHERPTV